jgi:putative MATE family efflux protein
MSAAPDRARFLTGSILRHVVVMALTGSLGMTFMFLVDAATLYWIGRLKDPEMLAAAGYAGNILFFTLSGGIGMMIATVVLVSRNVGAGNLDEAKRQVTSALILGIGAQTLFAFLIWLFRDRLLVWSGAGGEALDLGRIFLTVTLGSLPFMVAGMIAGGVLRAIGDARRSMYVTIVGGAVAMVLDPLVIVYWAQGLPGAAWVWALARIAMGLSGLWFVIGTHRMAARPDMAHAARLAPVFAGLALPLVLTQLSTPFGGYLLTSVMAGFGEAAVAAWAVAGRLYMLAFAGLFALAGALGGIIGQNLGAGRMHRVAETVRGGLWYSFVYALIAGLLLFLAEDAVMAGFSLPEAGRVVVHAFGLTAWTAAFTGALFVANVLFNTVGRPIWATGFNWLRDGVVLWPLATLMAAWLGAPGVVYANGMAAILTGCLAAFMAMRLVTSLKGDVGGPVTPPAVRPI